MALHEKVITHSACVSAQSDYGLNFSHLWILRRTKIEKRGLAYGLF